MPLPRRLSAFAGRALLQIDPETGHELAISALRMGLVPPAEAPDPPELATELAGLKLANPVGLAAGFDKNGVAAGALARLGFGFVEVGTVTPRPQAGSPRPRLFRLSGAGGVINRMGFNNDGHATVGARLGRVGAALGVNIGANKDSVDFVADYVAGVARFAEVANYLTVNISSPNTPGLRDLQAGEALRRLLGEVLAARGRAPRPVPIFLKLAPDLDERQMDEIASLIAATDLDGLIVSNTTLSRPGVAGLPQAQEAGGLSGRPLFALSTQRLAQMRQRVGNALPIIGVGGVHSAGTARAKFEAGANAIQLYSALVFDGFELVDDIKSGLAASLRAEGRGNIAEIVGTRTADWAAGRGEP